MKPKRREVLELAREALSLALSDVDWRFNSPTQSFIHTAYKAVDGELFNEAHRELEMQAGIHVSQQKEQP